MIINLILGGILGLAALVVGAILFKKKVPRRLKRNYFEKKWQELQGLLKDRSLWPEAIIRADNLLDIALKRRRFRGKSMGERLVSAQRMFTDNDTLWYAHKLRMKLEAKPGTKVRKNDVKDALIGLKQALKDLGAL